jgi:transposase
MNQDRFWLTDTQFSKIERHLPTDTRGKARVDDRRVISGIVHVLKSGGRWIDAPSERIAAARPPCPARTTLSLPEQVGRAYETSEALGNAVP